MSEIITVIYPPEYGEEYILCAAIKTMTPEHIFCGYRHNNIIEQINKLGIKYTSSCPCQGFLTSHNRFVDREEAYKIAGKMKQIKFDVAPPRLFSECLY